MEYFKTELSYIQDKELVRYVVDIINSLPCDDWKYKSASASGKYHPPCSNGYGGLVRHTKMVVANIITLATDNEAFTHLMDVFVAAAILHDLMKYPRKNMTTTDIRHPTLMANIIRNYADENVSNVHYYKTLHHIARLVARHQGKAQYSTDFNTGEVVNEIPVKAEEWLLHYADTLASKIYCNGMFDSYGNLITQYKTQPHNNDTGLSSCVICVNSRQNP